MAAYRKGLGPGPTAEDDAVAREVEEEIEAHLTMRTDELVAAGMDPDEARAEAVRRFGDEPRARRLLVAGARRRRLRTLVRTARDALAADVRLTLRSARHAPGFTAAALLIFAGGVGLTTTMFTVADHVLLRPLPYESSEELVALWSVGEPGSGIAEFPFVSMSNWVDWKEGATTLEATALHASHLASVAIDDGAFYATTTRVTGGFFPTMRTDFVLGRAFTEAEGQAEEPVAVVAEGFWRRVLGGTPDVRAVELVVDGRRFSVIGVVPRLEAFPGGTEIWVPMGYRGGSGFLRNNINYEAVARLMATATIEQADNELDAVAEGIRTSDPAAIYSWGVGVRPLREVVVGSADTYLRLLTAAVCFLLLVTSANLAGLSVARARRQAHETAVHLALGSGRARLAARTVTEHVVLALAGGGAGVAAAWLATGTLMSRLGTVVPRADEVGFDGRVAALGVGAALLAGLLAGLVPALTGSRGDLSGLLSGSRGAVTGGRGLPGAVMVGTEIALALALLVAGSLLLRSFRAVVTRDLGFEAEGVVALDMSLVGPEYEDPESRLGYWDAVRERLAALPGVEEVALSNAIPTSAGGRGFIDLPGREGDQIGAGYRVVSDGYFDALGIPLIMGRSFDASDEGGTERVTVVNRSMVEDYWPDEDPLGQRVRARSMELSFMFASGVAPWLTVVGVVGDARQYGHESDPQSEMYVLHRQVPYYTRWMSVVVKARPGVAAPEPAMRAAVAEVDPRVAVRVAGMQARLAGLTGERRMILAGLGLFGGAALFLVCLGIYGLMSFAAGERRREIAVRVALGARSTRIVHVLLKSTLWVVLSGSTAGLVAALGFTRLLESLLVDVAPTDPVSYVGAVAVLNSVALIAAAAPTLRAAREDPLEALREEA